MSFSEPNLNPPCDEKLERISDYVDDLALKNMADEIQSYGLEEKVKETILSLEIPNASDFIKEVIDGSNLHFLMKIISNKTIEDIRETLIDYLYWRDDEKL